MPRYRYVVDLEDSSSTHARIVELVGPRKKVLEIGCAVGHLSKFLRERGCTIVGVEVDPVAAREAAAHCHQVVIGDVEVLDLPSLFEQDRFDVAVVGDVLEHLRRPDRLLQQLSACLGPEGYLVASIPNVAHASVRLALLKGEFRYRPQGLLDSTHLRFFTLSTIRAVFADAGYRIEEVRGVPLGPFDSEVQIRPDEFPKAVLEFVLQDPEASVYQYVLRAYPAAVTRPEQPSTNKASGDFISLERHVQDLQEQLQSTRAELQQVRHRLRRYTEFPVLGLGRWLRRKLLRLHSPPGL